MLKRLAHHPLHHSQRLGRAGQAGERICGLDPGHAIFLGETGFGCDIIEHQRHGDAAVGQSPWFAGQPRRVGGDKKQPHAPGFARCAGLAGADQIAIDPAARRNIGLGSVKAYSSTVRAGLCLNPQPPRPTGDLGMGQGDSRFTGQQARQPRSAQRPGCTRGKQTRCQHHIFRKRLDHQSAAQRFEHGSKTGRIEPKSAIFRRKWRSDQAQFTQ